MSWRELAGSHSNLAKFSQNFGIFLKNLLSSANYLTFPAIPAKFREICGEKSMIWRKFCKILKKSRNFSKISQNSEKICKILEMQFANCVDLEKREKMSLLSLS